MPLLQDSIGLTDVREREHPGDRDSSSPPATTFASSARTPALAASWLPAALTPNFSTAAKSIDRVHATRRHAEAGHRKLDVPPPKKSRKATILPPAVAALSRSPSPAP